MEIIKVTKDSARSMLTWEINKVGEVQFFWVQIVGVFLFSYWLPLVAVGQERLWGSPMAGGEAGGLRACSLRSPPRLGVALGGGGLLGGAEALCTETLFFIFRSSAGGTRSSEDCYWGRWSLLWRGQSSGWWWSWESKGKLPPGTPSILSEGWGLWTGWGPL